MTKSFKERLSEKEAQIGLWLSLANPLSADAVSRIGYDWLLCDTEHAPLEVTGVLPVLQAADQHTNVVVRVAWNDKVLIKRHLDQGAHTLLVPFVNSVEEAEAAVAATRYPPEGIRGVAGATRASSFGTDPGYLKRANSEIGLIVQIETEEALNNIEGIAGVEGVDAIFIGPSDLAASMGHLGNPSHDGVQAAIKSGLEKTQKMHVPAGILATTTQDARRYVEWGFAFVAAGLDIGLLMASAKERLLQVREQ